jgi:hypothetical protein
MAVEVAVPLQPVHGRESGQLLQIHDEVVVLRLSSPAELCVPPDAALVQVDRIWNEVGQ